MLFRQLEYLVALSREKHFTRAAEACFVSQPALSEAIRKLEVELDVPLVVRGHKFEGFTTEGERIVLWARRIMADHDALKQEADAVRTEVCGTVRLGVVPTASAAVADLTAPLCRRYPLINVTLSEDLPSDDIAARLDRFEIDGGVTYIDSDVSARYRTIPLYREYYELLTASDIARPVITPTPSITWAEAVGLPMCTLPSVMRGRRIIDEYFADEGAQHVAQIETDSIASLYAHVKTGQWAAVVPRVWMQVFGSPPGLTSTPLVGRRPAPMIGLITNSGSPASVLVRALEDTAASLTPPDPN